MSILGGCHANRNMVGIVEIDCPECGKNMEVFNRDGILAAEARCEHCRFAMAAGTPTEELLMENNQTFREMFRAAKEMLAGKDPAEMAEKAGVTFDGAAFHIPCMGKELTFSYPEYLCTTPMHDWHYLTILHYLNLADGSPVTGQPIGMADMPAGLVRGTKYDRTMAQALTVFLKGKTEEQVKAILSDMGAEFLSGKADLNVKLPFLPRFPLYLNIWFADEDFPPSARLLVDRCAEHYLAIEDAVSVGDVVIDLLMTMI